MSMPIFFVNWAPKITNWAHVSRSTNLGVCPPTWIVDLVLSTMAISVSMEVLSLGTTFGNEWKTLWKKWLSTMPLMTNKSTSAVFLAPFFYVNVESKVWEPIGLTMLEPMTKWQTPFLTHEPIECLSKVLNGTFVTCGLRISRGPDWYPLVLQLCPWCLASNLEN
jgi:hypothetical protein